MKNRISEFVDGKGTLGSEKIVGNPPATDIAYSSSSELYETPPTNVDEALKGMEGAVGTNITQAVEDWLDENITEPTDPVIDASLTVSGAAADAKIVGDKIKLLNYGKTKPEAIENKYYNYNGDLVSYPGWSATPVLDCSGAKYLYIYSPVRSTYNVFFNGPNGGSAEKVALITLEVGDNVKEIPAGATHFGLSNTTAGIAGTVFKALATYDELQELKKEVDANTEAIENLEQEGTAEKTSVLYLNPKYSVGNMVIQSTKKDNPWNITPRPTVQDIVTFGVVTDLHGSKTELERFIQFCEEYSDYINGGLLSLGDMVSNVYDNDYSYWINTPGADKIMLTIGNHDVWLTNSVSSQLADKVSAYNKYFSPNVSTWNVVQPTGAESNGLMYYYKDYPSSILRIIILDCMYWTENENTWFINALNDAKTNGYHVLAVQHYNPAKNISAMNGNFNSLDYGFSNLVLSSGAAQMKASVEDFINAGGNFVGWLSGDAHYDAFGVYANNNIKQPSFTFECGGRGAGYTDAERVAGQKSQDSFNIVSVDTFSKLIKIVRVGNDKDRFLRSKKYLTYNYESDQVISCG